MILSFLSHYMDPDKIPSAPKTSMVRYNQYLNKAYIKLMMMLSRRSNELISSKGVIKIGQMLNTIDITYLNNQPSDFERYGNYWMYERINLDNLLSNPPTTPNRMTLFNKGLHTTNEYWISVRGTDYLNTLPFDQPLPLWDTVHPLRIHDVDAMDPLFVISNNLINFQKIQPKYAYVLIDSVAMGMKYYQYQKLYGQNTYQFVHDVIIPDLYMDIAKIWLTKQLLRMFQIKSSDQINYVSPSVKYYYNSIDSGFNRAMVEVYDLIKDIRNGKSLFSFLQSVMIYEKRLDYEINGLLLRNHISIEDDKLWMHYARDVQYLKIIIELLTCNNHQQMSDIIRQKLKAMIRSKFWNHIKSTNFKQYVKEDVENLIDMVENI